MANYFLLSSLCLFYSIKQTDSVWYMSKKCSVTENMLERK